MPASKDRSTSRADVDPPASATPAAQTTERRVLRVSDLLQNERQVILEHAGERYVLRITAKGKLILTK